jgi:DNA-binding CsgD family transcriptional regulator
MTAHRVHQSNLERSVPVVISAEGLMAAGDGALQALFASADFGLSVRDGRVHASGSVEKRLKRALAQLCRDAKPVTVAFPERTECGALILDIRVANAAPDDPKARGNLQFAGTFRHAAPDNLPGADRIGQALGLSPAEAALSLALARGVSPDDYSRKHGVTKNTVRSQLAVIRKKTGARSQTQIANLIWLLASARV